MDTKSGFPQPLVFGLDIGTRSIVGTVGYQLQNEFHVVAQSVRLHETRAMIDGQIHDIGRVAETIKQVKTELELQLERPLREVCIAAAGRVLKTKVGHSTYEFNSQTVVNLDYIHSLEMLGVEQAHEEIVNEIGAQEKYYCVGYTVVKYYLNNYEISNLEGHKAYSIGADVLATFLPEEVVDGLYTAVEDAGLVVSNLTLEPIAAMNVAIPEAYRLLNICLVDVGAGTSDLCITKDGSVVGYGMIPSAGDEITELIVKKYLVDFATAEKIKMISPKRKSLTYKDIMGISHKITPKEVYEETQEIVDDITSTIAKGIKELNGGKSVSAVFVVGGGGKIPGFTKSLAKWLDLPEERVALRGEEVMHNIYMHDEKIKKDPLLVTPIGICLNYYEQKNHFIYVLVNEQRIKLYNNDKLTVFDAAMQLGLHREAIFPKRGKDLHFEVEGKARFIRGQQGEAAEIFVNEREASMNTPIEQNDQIVIHASTAGPDAKQTLGKLPEFSKTIKFFVNQLPVICPRFALVNGVLESEFYEIKDNDSIEIAPYYTLSQLLTFMDVAPSGKIYVNQELAHMDTPIYENFQVKWSEDLRFEDLEEADETDSALQQPHKANSQEHKEAVLEQAEETLLKDLEDAADIQNIAVIVNHKTYTLSGKKEYVFVEVFDLIGFDTKTIKGSELVLLLNGNKAELFDVLHHGDHIEIYWR